MTADGTVILRGGPADGQSFPVNPTTEQIIMAVRPDGTLFAGMDICEIAERQMPPVKAAVYVVERVQGQPVYAQFVPPR